MEQLKDNNYKKVDEKILLIMILGILEAVKNRAITIDEAEKFILSPHVMNELKTKECDEKIIDLIEKGCELENIASLLPERLNEEIKNLKKEAIEQLRTYEEFNKTFWLKE